MMTGRWMRKEGSESGGGGREVVEKKKMYDVELKITIEKNMKGNT